jgi:hypothetical protein
MRAERRLGELQSEEPKAKPRGNNQHKQDRSRKTTDPKTLNELGISKDLSARAPNRLFRAARDLVARSYTNRSRAA